MSPKFITSCDSLSTTGELFALGRLGRKSH